MTELRSDCERSTSVEDIELTMVDLVLGTKLFLPRAAMKVKLFLRPRTGMKPTEMRSIGANHCSHRFQERRRSRRGSTSTSDCGSPDKDEESEKDSAELSSCSADSGPNEPNCNRLRSIESSWVVLWAMGQFGNNCKSEFWKNFNTIN